MEEEMVTVVMVIIEMERIEMVMATEKRIEKEPGLQQPIRLRLHRVHRVHRRY